MTTAIILVAVLGGIFGLVLATAGKKFAVEEDPRINEVTNLLPGANCGGCGYAGCAALANAIVAGEADANKCVVANSDSKKAIGAVMGVEDTGDDENAIRYIPRLHCNGCTANRTRISNYEGVHNCYLRAQQTGGPGQCNYGCFGDGACVDACNFGALKIGANGLPEFDYNKCVGCEACAKACPQLLIEMIDASKNVLVECNNREKGKAAMTDCKVSCISCGMCAKNCPQHCITMEDGVNGSIPVIDYTKCDGCGICVEKCPRKCLVYVTPVTGSPEAPAKEQPTGCACCAMAANCPSAQAQAQARK
ncbi:RnfABCDGE type electron transport complex subunit B [Acidaminococcus sp. NSJ-142]|jgi:Na+-translocating ferredoxin:NAD+ oxidoreductase RNF subunit RnfB|uniref:RnfABCDGE type electron transport complex subunit B n=1 Tax=Acidaminococcus TaxID=904 RepID=UPI000CFA6FB4|nr:MULTISPECIES: RnfABCDGE type electron transport complex subunit B [Acidaminococcus]MCD2434543.1 RnfABCDGE type electron transport complex subunit B [Acidaminococcus hominis]MCH4096933.1 RnfABCDGE type electron transport complex subunit B [Acidaminococcus provencensis]RHK03821.1 RnfABCDGE type electron transport complex subunit B [Acidaminococcus sp. AM05-11]